MRPFRRASGPAVPLVRADVDTDQIIPKQFLKLVQRSGFGRYLFYNWRYLPDGSPDPEFVLNDPAYAGSPILLAGENFGCGSSREHAVWALRDHGFTAVAAPSFADIFYSNCFKNGVLPVRVTKGQAAALRAAPRTEIDLGELTVSAPPLPPFRFAVDPHRRRALLEGLDEVALTLEEHGAAISEFESRAPPRGRPPSSRLSS